MGSRWGAHRTLLGIYLNDRLAGATTGVELAWRLARRDGEWAGNGKLERLAEEVERDREALLGMMSAIGEQVRPLEIWAGWVARKLTRLKPNSGVLGGSALSRLVDLEAMRLGVEAKVAVWRALRARAAADPRLDTAKLDQLISAGRSQATRLERLRARAAEELLGPAR